MYKVSTCSSRPLRSKLVSSADKTEQNDDNSGRRTSTTTTTTTTTTLQQQVGYQLIKCQANPRCKRIKLQQAPLMDPVSTNNKRNASKPIPVKASKRADGDEPHSNKD
jgi:hypothetical protein